MQRSAPRDLIFLTLICGLTYAAGMTAHGLSNWQEAERALVAREMQTHGHWSVPTVYGKTYLLKPTTFYWCHLANASIRPARTCWITIRVTRALRCRLSR